MAGIFVVKCYGPMSRCLLNLAEHGSGIVYLMSLMERSRIGSAEEAIHDLRGEYRHSAPPRQDRS